MKPHDPAGPFAATVNWKHFWYCMQTPLEHPYMQKPERVVVVGVTTITTLPSVPYNNVVFLKRKRA